MTLESTQQSELIEAAEALAAKWITSRRSCGAFDDEHCLYCLRGAIGGVISHTDGCAVGRVVRAASALRIVLANPGLREILPAESDIASMSYGAPLLEELRPAEGCGGCDGNCAGGGVCHREASHSGSSAKPQTAVQERPEFDIASGLYGAPLLEEVRPVESDESWEASEAVLRAQAVPALAPSARSLELASDRLFMHTIQYPERRAVCGAILPWSAPALVTCDKEIGHDEDPRSDHWNRETGYSWPTAALIAEEVAEASAAGLYREAMDVIR